MIDWEGIGREIKRRREAQKLTQDGLSARVGVRLLTITQIEIDKRRPSLSLLEALAKTFHCSVKDLIQEKEEPSMPTTLTHHEPALLGAPAFFRNCVTQASGRKSLGGDGGPAADYSHPGYQLSLHLEEYLSHELWTELRAIWEPRNMQTLETETFEFLQREFPGCLALVPKQARRKFMEGVMKVLEEDYGL